MTDVWEVLGFVGVGLSALAYVPQIVHLAKERCSAGVSLKAWGMWTVAAVLVAIPAVRSSNALFIALPATSLTASVVIFALGKRYEGQFCSTHAHYKEPG